MAKKDIRLQIRSVDSENITDISSALHRELAIDETGKLFVGTENGGLSQIVAALPTAELDLKADITYVDSENANLKDYIDNADSILQDNLDIEHEERLSISYIPDFIPDILYRKNSVVILEINESFYIYRAKEEITPSYFNEDDWILLGSTDFGNVDGGRAASVYTMSQYIKAGKA